jgi:hypothetical protein
MQTSISSMKTPVGATSESGSKFTGLFPESSILKGHQQIGALISTLQGLSTEYDVTEGDVLCCDYNQLMFSKEFVAAVGKSRRVQLIRSILDTLNIWPRWGDVRAP